MVFSEYVFLFLFLPMACLAIGLCPARFRLLPLTFLSYLFYGWLRYDYCLLMLVSTILDYLVGLGLNRFEGRARRRFLLSCSIVGNLGILFFFKYRLFAGEAWNGLAHTLSLPTVGLADSLVLPVGISFYTFQSLSYTVDVYRKQIPPERNFILFAAYISMFPQLVAGPIVRFGAVRAGLQKLPITLEGVAAGSQRFMVGLAKKVLIADQVAPLAVALFDGGARGASNAWVGVLAFTVQIAFDFSGYSDMAIGLGRMLGLRLPENFDRPYRARSVTEFWRRWHMTLGAWFRDYVYIPLGGNRRSRARTLCNLVATMLLCGAWHGAAWVFIIWGAWHGAFLLIERTGMLRKVVGRGALGWAYAFLVVVLGWVWFKSPTAGRAIEIFGDLFGGTGVGTLDLLGYRSARGPLLALLSGLGFTFLVPGSATWCRRITVPRAALALGLFLMTILFLMFQLKAPFLYYQF